MYTLVLVVCALAVVLSPLVLDWYLSYQESRIERRVLSFAKAKGPRLAWASPRTRW